MAYPALAEGPATAAYAQRQDGGDVQAIVDERTTFPEGADFDPELAHEVLNECFDLEPHLRSSSRWRFDGAVARLLHARLQLSTVCAGDADFWRWLTFAYGGCGAELVDLRYGRPMSESAEAEDGATMAVRPVYYGLRQMKKGMFAKLWICAASMYRPNQSDPYDGLDYMDVDLWDSHIIDPDYGSVPEMARAFVLVVRDREIPRDVKGSADGTAGYRQLAREIRRRYPTTAFELFDDAVAYAWVDSLWANRRQWCRISPWRSRGSLRRERARACFLPGTHRMPRASSVMRTPGALSELPRYLLQQTGVLASTTTIPIQERCGPFGKCGVTGQSFGVYRPRRRSGS